MNAAQSQLPSDAYLPIVRWMRENPMRFRGRVGELMKETGKDAVIIADRMLPARMEERGIKLRKSFEGGVVGDESFHVYHLKNAANQKESSN